MSTIFGDYTKFPTIVKIFSHLLHIIRNSGEFWIPYPMQRQKRLVQFHGNWSWQEVRLCALRASNSIPSSSGSLASLFVAAISPRYFRHCSSPVAFYSTAWSDEIVVVNPMKTTPYPLGTFTIALPTVSCET